jgi:hypothetical protein
MTMMGIQEGNRRRPMNARAARLEMILVASFISISMASSASAQSRPSDGSSATRRQHDCQELRAESIETVGDVANFIEVGVITNGGILNGTTEYVFDPATGSVRVTDPDVVSWFSAFTLTTKRGELKAHNVFLYNLVTGLWTSMAQINPATSTGRFARATGILYFNGSTIGVVPDSSYPSDVLAHICLADR